MLTFAHLAFCAAVFFSFSFSGVESPSTAAAADASRIYLDLFALFLIALALLFFRLQSNVPSIVSPWKSSLGKFVTLFILAFFVTCDALLTGNAPAGDTVCANCWRAFALFLAGLAFLFMRVCAGVGSAPSAAVLIGFLLVRLGADVFFYRAYPIQWNGGADFIGCFDLQQFQLCTAGVVIVWADA